MCENRGPTFDVVIAVSDDVFPFAESLISHVILDGYRRIMYKNVSITIIMASAIAAILIVPWAVL